MAELAGTGGPRLDETWYPPTWRGRPPSMPWTDWQVWQRYLISPHALYERYAYDALLPVQSPPASVTDPAMRKMWLENTGKRIDAIGRIGDAYTILEVRELATWQTLGQVLGYQTLAELHFPGDIWTRPVIVADAIAAGVEPAIRAQGVGLVLVPAPELAPATRPA
ncbi:MAG TPA: hypothetical protein VF909_08220 [Roseiflexaceae bacterium]